MGGKRHEKKKPPRKLAARPLFVFDRERTHHPWAAALDPRGDSDPGRLAVRENWRMDARVDSGRETVLLASGSFDPPPSSYADWKGQAEVYYKEHSWAIGDRSNAGNRIRRGPRPSEKLLHVVSFGRLLWFLLERDRNRFRSRWTGSFPGLGTSLPFLKASDYSDQVWRLAEELNRLGLAEVQRAAGFLADQLGPKEPPWWAGFAAELEGFLAGEDWLGLARVLGAGHLRAGETLLVFRYSVNDAIRATAGLYRPTVIEAPVNPCHFPSPVASPYGFTMPLEDGGGVYCQEMIHPPLKGAAAQRACVLPMVRLASDVLEDYSRLPSLRAQQRLRLEKEWPDKATGTWLKRHTPAPTP